ncbi:MAG: hypothetical protein JKY67_16345 [Pseudomonadales bacterium]|nr:hypothetical protein [Pseudomonadales bacterium]
MADTFKPMQQVNLFPQALKPTVDWLSPARMLFYLALLVSLLVGVTAISYWELGLAESELQVAAMRKASAESALTLFQESKLKSTLKPSAAENLAARIKSAKETLAVKTRVTYILGENRIGYGGGYSKFFEGLRRARVSGLTLREIRISEGARRIALAGEVLKAKQLPEYLANLSNETTFVGRRFEMLELYREKQSSRSMVFSLRTSEQ